MEYVNICPTCLKPTGYFTGERFILFDQLQIDEAFNRGVETRVSNFECRGCAYKRKYGHVP